MDKRTLWIWQREGWPDLRYNAQQAAPFLAHVFLGGLNAEKYMKLTHVSNSMAKRDLAEMVAQGQFWIDGAGKATRYYINVPGWKHGIESKAVDGAKAEKSEQDLRRALDAAGYAVQEHSAGQDRVQRTKSAQPPSNIQANNAAHENAD